MLLLVHVSWIVFKLPLKKTFLYYLHDAFCVFNESNLLKKKTELWLGMDMWRKNERIGDGVAIDLGYFMLYCVFQQWT